MNVMFNRRTFQRGKIRDRRVNMVDLRAQNINWKRIQGNIIHL